MNIKITTNNRERQFINYQDLTKSEQSDFDYQDKEEQDDMDYFRYRGHAYCVDQFMIIKNHPDKDFSSYDGYMSDSMFSGVLIRLDLDDSNYYQIATYTS